MYQKEKNNKRPKPTRSRRRRVWFSVTRNQQGYGISIHPDFGAACKKACRLFLRTVLLAVLVCVSGCEGADSVKHAVLAVVHSMFGRSHGGTKK